MPADSRLHGESPLLPYLPPHNRIWECAGAGWLAQWLEEGGHTVIATDYADGHDALEWAPDSSDYDLIVTNPPFSLKYQFIARLFALGKPGPAGAITRPTVRRRKGTRAAGKSWEELVLDTRINFIQIQAYKQWRANAGAVGVLMVCCPIPS